VASVQAKGGVTINSDPSLEREADALGSLAARGERVHVGGASSRIGGASRIGSAPDVMQPAYTAKRALGRGGKGWMMGPAYHMHIFFEDASEPTNIGFMGKQGLGQDAWDETIYEKVETGLNDAKMRDAVTAVGDPGAYSLLGNNCQSYVTKVMAEYKK
jgi:hypothetical protein